MIVGEGEEKENIKNIVKRYKLQDRVSIMGFTDDIKKYFLDSSVLLLSSRWEGMPMIVLEALEMGVPTISYNITAAQQLIENNREGILVNKFDISEFSNSMLKLANSFEDRRSMSKNAIERSDEFAIDRIVEQWNDMFRVI